MDKECFLCGEAINDKISKEHIFGDSFLKWMDLKNKKYKCHLLKTTKEYSRLKVRSHAKCNNEFGSRFEENILNLLKTFDSNRDILRKLHIINYYPEVKPVKDALSQWMAKIYVGLIYWEANLSWHASPNYQPELLNQINSPLVKQLQFCFKNGFYFNIPSSLYYFRIPSQIPSGFEFDFANRLPHNSIYIKFKEHLLVASIADANLVQEWFTDLQYQKMQTYINECSSDISECSSKYSAAYLHAVSHIWAIRENLPVQPKIVYTKSGVTDRSRLGISIRPEMNDELVNERANQLFNELVLKFKQNDA